LVLPCVLAFLALGWAAEAEAPKTKAVEKSVEHNVEGLRMLEQMMMRQKTQLEQMQEEQKKREAVDQGLNRLRHAEVAARMQEVLDKVQAGDLQKALELSEGLESELATLLRDLIRSTQEAGETEIDPEKLAELMAKIQEILARQEEIYKHAVEVRGEMSVMDRVRGGFAYITSEQAKLAGQIMQTYEGTVGEMSRLDQMIAEIMQLVEKQQGLMGGEFPALPVALPEELIRGLSRLEGQVADLVGRQEQVLGETRQIAGAASQGASSSQGGAASGGAQQGGLERAQASQAAIAQDAQAVAQKYEALFGQLTKSLQSNFGGAAGMSNQDGSQIAQTGPGGAPGQGSPGIGRAAPGVDSTRTVGEQVGAGGDPSKGGGAALPSGIIADLGAFQETLKKLGLAMSSLSGGQTGQAVQDQIAALQGLKGELGMIRAIVTAARGIKDMGEVDPEIAKLLAQLGLQGRTGMLGSSMMNWAESLGAGGGGGNNQQSPSASGGQPTKGGGGSGGGIKGNPFAGQATKLVKEAQGYMGESARQIAEKSGKEGIPGQRSVDKLREAEGMLKAFRDRLYKDVEEQLAELAKKQGELEELMKKMGEGILHAERAGDSGDDGSSSDSGKSPKVAQGKNDMQQEGGGADVPKWRQVEPPEMDQSQMENLGRMADQGGKQMGQLKEQLLKSYQEGRSIQDVPSVVGQMMEFIRDIDKEMEHILERKVKKGDLEYKGPKGQTPTEPEWAKDEEIEELTKEQIENLERTKKVAETWKNEHELWRPIEETIGAVDTITDNQEKVVGMFRKEFIDAGIWEMEDTIVYLKEMIHDIERRTVNISTKIKHVLSHLQPDLDRMLEKQKKILASTQEVHGQRVQ
jgi:hypothetical protein